MAKPIIGLTASAFDLMHPGHVHFLREARLKCDHLIACLQTSFADAPNKGPMIQTVHERYAMLDACKYVDEIIPYESEDDLLNLLTTTRHNVRFLGSDYIDKVGCVTGENLYSAWHEIDQLDTFDFTPDEMLLVYIPRRHTWSSTDMRNRLR